MGLGISVYPLLSSKEENLEYIKKARNLGYERIFTSMLEVSKEKEEALKQVDIYRDILTYARDLGMRVFIDINPEVLKNIDIDPKDLKFFVDLGCTGIRLDGVFNGIYESMMTYNEYGLEIEINGSFNSAYVNNIVDLKCNKEKLVVCHNFYPEEYTALSKDYFKSCMKRHKDLGLKVAAFVNATKGGMQGPWPANDGLPTLEKHRHLDILAQGQELKMFGVDDIIIGNAFATDEELEALTRVNSSEVVLKMDTFRELTEIEKSFIEKSLSDRKESGESVIRHSYSRVEFKNTEIKKDREETIVVKRGTVLLNNDGYLNYKGELLIAKEDIRIDNRRNIVGYINEDYINLLDFIYMGQKFRIVLK